MIKRTFIPPLLAILFATTPQLSVAELDFDLQTLIAGIKHFDAVVMSGKGEFVYEHYLGGEEKKAYIFTFEGTTLETARVRADFLTSGPLTEIWDGERQWGNL